jgi:phosphatidylserine decarboxylase
MIGKSRQEVFLKFRFYGNVMPIKNISLKKLCVKFLLHILPYHSFSRFLELLSHCENVAWKNYIIKKYAKYYKINTKEAISRDLKNYPSFNHFYTRRLKPESRPVTDIWNGVASPVDGTVHQTGIINEGEIFLAKGHKFSVTVLLGGDNKLAGLFNKGVYK